MNNKETLCKMCLKNVVKTSGPIKEDGKIIERTAICNECHENMKEKQRLMAMFANAPMPTLKRKKD